MKRDNVDADLNAKGMPPEDEGREGVRLPPAEEHQRRLANRRTLGERHGATSSETALALGLPAPESVRQ